MVCLVLQLASDNLSSCVPVKAEGRNNGGQRGMPGELCYVVLVVQYIQLPAVLPHWHGRARGQDSGCTDLAVWA
jgi:hypothetical protein